MSDYGEWMDVRDGATKPSQFQWVVGNIAVEVVDETALRAATLHADADFDGIRDDRDLNDAAKRALQDLIGQALRERGVELGFGEVFVNIIGRPAGPDGSIPRFTLPDLPA